MVKYSLPLSCDDFGKNDLKAITKQFKTKKYTMGAKDRSKIGLN